MKIKYYTVYDSGEYNQYPEELSKNFISIDRAKQEVRNHFKFNPGLSITRFGDLYQYTPVTTKRPVYKFYKSGPKKGQIMEKNGEKIIVDHWDDVVHSKVNDYSGYEVTEYDFKNGEYYHLKYKKGFFKLKYEILPAEETIFSIKYKAQVFIQFIEAKITYTPEIKEIGKPYQVAGKKIEVTKESEFFPLYQCKKYDYLQYGINNNMDNWARTDLVFIEHEVSIEENNIEIIE